MNMKKRVPLLFLLIVSVSVLCTSCKVHVMLKGTGKTIRYALKCERLLKREQYTFDCEKHPFILKDNAIFIAAETDGKKDTLFFDTGYSGFVSETATSDTDFKIRPVISHSLQTATKRLWQKQGLSVHDIRTPWVDISNCVCKLTCSNLEEKGICHRKKKSEYKCAGFSLMPNYYGHSIMLSFSDTTMQLLDSNAAYDTTGYVRVPADFSHPLLYIRMKVDSVEYRFLFDTGCDQYLFLKKHNTHAKPGDRAFFGEIGQDVSGIITDTTYLQFTRIQTFGTYSDSIPVFYLKQFHFNVMGLGLISCYDWIIDRQHKVLYAKRIHSQTLNLENVGPYSVKEHDSSLVITRIPILENGQVLSLGTRIRSVDGVPVTSDNICHYKQLLNNTADWSIFHIEYEKPEKEE